MNSDRNRLILEVATEGFWDWDLKADIAYLSPRYCELIGYSPEDAVFNTAFLKKMIHPDDHERAFAALTNHIQEKQETMVVEYRVITKDNRTLWIEARGKTVEFDEDGKPSRIVGTVINTTERKRMEELLRASEERFRGMMELSPDIFSIISEDGVLVYNSPAALRIHGYSTEEMAGRNTFDLIHPDDQAVVSAAMAKLLSEPSGTASVQYRYRHKDGRYMWMEATASNHVTNPSIRGLVVVSRDITERKLAEDILFKSEQRYRAIVENETEYVSRFLPGGILTYVNPALARLAGISAEAFLGNSFYPFVHDEDRETLMGRIESLSPELPVCTMEHRALSSGVWCWHQWTISALFDETGQFLEYQGVGRDVTERKLAEKEREQYLQFFVTSSDLMCIAGMDGYFKKINPSFSRTLGFSEQEVLARHFLEFIHPDDRQSTREETARQLQGHLYTANFENRYLCRDGSFRWLSWNAVCDRTEGVVYGIARDITEQKRVEIELAEAKEAAEAANKAKSRFLANMSHEIRTPLNGIVGILQLLSFTEISSVQKQYLEVMHSASENLLGLINDILDLSRIEAGKMELERHEFSLRKSVGDVIKSQIYLIREKGLSLVTRIPPEVPDNLTGDELRLKQVLLNLVGNAVKFTPTGEIALSIVVEERREDTVVLRFSVADTGIGMKPESVESIFAPFHQADASTTRKFGGSGLGLSICTGFVELMGGKIWAESVEGAGSTFRVLLPFTVNELQVVHHHQPAEPPVWAGAPLRILFAEDTSSSRMLCETILRMDGHEVDSVRNGAEAVEKWGQNEYDLILMDVQMPEMDGIEATHIIRERERQTGGHIPIIALTAHAMRDDRALLMAQGVDGYVTKPLQIVALHEEIKRCLY